MEHPALNREWRKAKRGVGEREKMRDPNDGGEGKVRTTNYRAAPLPTLNPRSQIIQSR